MDLIKLNVLPPMIGADRIAELVIASAATRIVKSFVASPWEVFLRPEDAGRYSIYLNHQPRTSRQQPPHKGR